MTNVHTVRMARSPRFVVDLILLLLGYRNHPGRFDDGISPEFVCDVRDLSIPFGLLPFVEPIFPVPLPTPPTFAPDARPFGPCVNTVSLHISIFFLLFRTIDKTIHIYQNSNKIA